MNISKGMVFSWDTTKSVAYKIDKESTHFRNSVLQLILFWTSVDLKKQAILLSSLNALQILGGRMCNINILEKSNRFDQKLVFFFFLKRSQVFPLYNMWTKT